MAAIQKMTREELISAQGNLVEIKIQLKNCKKLQGRSLENGLMDISSERLWNIDKRMVKTIQALPNHVNDYYPNIKYQIDNMISRVERKLDLIARELKKKKNK